MPTIGELLAKIRNGGINPEPSGDSPYGGVTPGTDSPISVPGIDDISDETKADIGDYLSQRTKGFERLEERNNFPIEPDLVSAPLTDTATGNPAPLRTIASPQTAFVNPTPASAEELSIRDGFEILKGLGFFNDLEGDDGPFYDKNAQTDGHNLLNRPDVSSKVLGVLATNRFSALTTPNSPFAIPVDLPEYDFIDEEGVRKDHPQLEKIKEIAAFVINTGKRAKEAYPDAKLVRARDPDATGIDAFGISANLKFGELNEDTGIDPATGTPDSSQPSSNTPPDENNTQLDGMSSIGVPYGPDFPYGVDTNELGAQAIKLALDLIVDAIGPATDLLNGLFGLFGYNGIYTNNPNNPLSLTAGMRFGFGNFPPPSQIDFSTGEVAELPTFPAANQGYKFIQSLNVPLPRFLIGATGNPNEIVENIITLGVQHVKNQLDQDPQFVNYWKSFIRKAQRIFSAENNFGLPELPDISGGLDPSSGLLALVSSQKFIQELSECDALKFIRSMAVMAETVAATSVSGGSALQPQGYRFGTRDLNELVNSAANRHASYAKKGYRRKVGSRTIPSLLLLPAALQRSIDQFRAVPSGSSNVAFGLDTNVMTNTIYDDLLQMAIGPTIDGEVPNPGTGAQRKKSGKPVRADANRFSRSEVEAIENVLEAEHMPFYFHDLRTNEIVSFNAFLNALSDSFSPSFNASSGFGRIDDVQIYQKTTRAIQVDFTLVSLSKKDMKEMYLKMNKLVSMVYPQFSRGTMLEHTNATGNVTRFVQPFSQVTTATPIIRLRVGDLVKSNYSREAIARMMGAGDEDFQVLGPTPAPPIDAPLPCQTVVQNIIEATTNIPVTTTGEYDPTRGWPVGSIVIVDPDYNRGADDPLVAFDPETNTVGSDWSADIVPGRFGVRIVSYHTFNNPLGGSNPNIEEIVIKVEHVPMMPPDYFPTTDRIATRESTGEAITSGFLSYSDIQTEDSARLYCDGINVDLFEGRIETTQQVPPEEGTPEAQPIPADPEAVADMHKRLFGDKNPIMRSFETTAGRGLAGVITSLNFDWGLNGEINWDVVGGPGFKAPQGCKISISFTPIHDITPGLDSDGMMRAPVFNVAGSSPHGDEDPHPTGGYARRVAVDVATMDQKGQALPPSTDETS